MRLSEAMRLGALLRPQGFWSKQFRASQDTTCAVEAVAEAMGWVYRDVGPEKYIALWPWLPTTCPVCGRLFDYGSVMIAVCLNDQHQWTRERIADWVATHEPSAESETPPMGADPNAVPCMRE